MDNEKEQSLKDKLKPYFIAAFLENWEKALQEVITAEPGLMENVAAAIDYWDAAIIKTKLLSETFGELLPRDIDTDLMTDAAQGQAPIEEFTEESNVNVSPIVYTRALFNILSAFNSRLDTVSKQLTLWPADETTAAREILHSVIPQIGYKPVTKLSNESTRDFLNSGEIELRISNALAKKEIITRAMLKYDDENLSFSGKHTPYDREVSDSVTTSYIAGNRVVTPAMVYRAMNGFTSTERVSKKAVDKVRESLEKCLRIRVKIDFTQEARAYGRDVTSAVLESYLLALRKTRVISGGVEMEAYEILEAPILYEYARVSGQIISFPISLLQTKDAVNSTEEVIVIRGYLLRQIEGMKSKTFKRSNRITYDGIYKELDIEPEYMSGTKALTDVYKKKTRTTRKHVDAILSSWKAQGYIKGYKPYKEGNTIKGIEIML